MTSLDKVQDASIIEPVDNDLEKVAAMEIDEINELASMLAAVGMDEEDEAVLDRLYAEHQAMMYAAQSYDNDAVDYGDMV